MTILKGPQTEQSLQQEVLLLRQRVAELEAREKQSAAAYADFLFDNSGESILIVDPYTMNILAANPNAARRLGYQQAEICQMLLSDIEIPHQTDVQDAETSWQSSTSGTFFYEGQYRHKSGRLIPVEVSSRMVYWQKRDVLINFARDISWRKEAESALRQMNTTLERQVRDRTAELAAEKEKLETVLGSIAEGVAMMDAMKNIIYVNPAFAYITLFHLPETGSIHIEKLFEFSARDLQAQAAAFAEGRVWSGEVKGKRPDGRQYPALLTMVPMLDENGRISGYVTSHQDISQFQALDKAHYSFITNVSHQLRTPLTNIKLYTQLLQEGLQSAKAPHYLNVLTTQADRLEHLVQDILELASLDSGERVLEQRAINLPEMLIQMTEAHQKRAQAKQLSLDYTIEGAIPKVIGDPMRLRQAFCELLDNAFAYTPSGGVVSMSIAALAQDNHHWVAVTVQDNGPGISAEERVKIFERFFRGHLAEQGHIIGTGLGLCIAQRIAHAHHGHVAVASEPGRGAAFTIWLPVGTA